MDTIYGTAINTELKGTTTRYAHLHVYGLDPTTSDASITQHLKVNGITDIKLEKLKSKHPHNYASYKLSVPFEMLKEIKTSNFWPCGVKINRFLE